MQQQNKRTQYSMPAPGAGAWLWDWLRVEYWTDTLGSTGSARTHPELSTDKPADASAEAFALSFDGWKTGGDSAATSTPADRCGALGGGN